MTEKNEKTMITEEKFTHKEMLNLKKCPFCGGTPWIERTVTLTSSNDYPYFIDYTIYCHDCGFKNTQDSEEVVITKWEKRVETQ